LKRGGNDQRDWFAILLREDVGKIPFVPVGAVQPPKAIFDVIFGEEYSFVVS
jgi:hypothetical protein